MPDKPKPYQPRPGDLILPPLKGDHNGICLIISAAPGEYEVAEYLCVLYYYQTESYDRRMPHFKNRSGDAIPRPEYMGQSQRYAAELWRYLIRGIGLGLSPHVLDQARKAVQLWSYEEMGDYLDRKFKETLERERSTDDTGAGSGPAAGED